MFETGVDEMSWDDTVGFSFLTSAFHWNIICLRSKFNHEVKHYRQNNKI